MSDERIRDDLREARRLLNGASSLIRAELSGEWSDHADDIDRFLSHTSYVEQYEPNQ